MARIRFPASDGIELEGDLRFPEGGAAGVAVVCHPHPRFGGSKDSWMIPVLQTTLVAAGWVALRFDFRGVGGSAGEQGAGAGEVADVAGAVDRVLEHGAPALLAGWSFGAQVALLHALDDERVRGWVGVSLPVASTRAAAPDLPRRLGAWGAAKLFIHGSADELTEVSEVEELVEAAAEPRRLRVIDGGDHFLTAHGDVLSAEVTRLADELSG